MSDTPDSPGRMVRMSALGLTSDALIPKAARSCGVATYTGPDQERPGAACCSEALLCSSSIRVFEPRALAMFWATAAWAVALARAAASWAVVGRVHDDLVAGQVRPGVVQDVAVPLRGQDADQGGDEDPEADGREGRA